MVDVHSSTDQVWFVPGTLDDRDSEHGKAEFADLHITDYLPLRGICVGKNLLAYESSRTSKENWVRLESK
ncbi:MAG: hypothetical protein JWQ71_947 [Pedosphaera sp.]|nr:hypothetical protein [Pedosphaera sp.]